MTKVLVVNHDIDLADLVAGVGVYGAAGQQDGNERGGVPGRTNCGCPLSVVLHSGGLKRITCAETMVIALLAPHCCISGPSS